MEKSADQKPRFKFVLPTTLVLMFIIVLFACAMTWIIPAGDFNYVKT